MKQEGPGARGGPFRTRKKSWGLGPEAGPRGKSPWAPWVPRLSTSPCRLPLAGQQLGETSTQGRGQGATGGEPLSTGLA